MRATLSLIRREFAAYFTGPIGYVALFSFLVLNGLLFWLVVGLLLSAWVPPAALLQRGLAWIACASWTPTAR